MAVAMLRYTTACTGESARTTALENAANVWPLGKLVLVGGLGVVTPHLVEAGNDSPSKRVLGRSRFNNFLSDAFTKNAVIPDTASARALLAGEERDPTALSAATSDQMKP